MINNYKLLFLMAMVTSLLFLFVACQEESSKQASTSQTVTFPNIKIGDVIAETRRDDINGQPITIASHADVNGQLVVVYAPNCQVCHATIPRWNELYRQFFAPRNIPLIALSIEPRAETLKSIEQLNIPFKVVLMPDVDQMFRHRIADVPTTIALAADGTVKGLWVGQLNRKELEEVIQIFCPSCNVEINKT